jgi:hypothetical protein
MEEISNVIKKYDETYISNNLRSVAEINKFATIFYKDVADIYDCITRVKNVDRNPTGFSLSDAPILGLLVRIWKLLREIIRYYEENNAEIISILERPLIEAAVTATYLLQNDDSVIEDYRKCSYKDRLRILRELKEGSSFFETKAGKRLLKSVNEKMELENFSVEDFKIQKKNRWKLQGKRFFDIFSKIINEQLYKHTYGMMSESIHGSWNESMDFCLKQKDDGTFSPFPFYHRADIRYVSPTLKFCNPPFKLWLERIEANDKYLLEVLNWVERVNTRLFMMFDEQYDG